MGTLPAGLAKPCGAASRALPRSVTCRADPNTMSTVKQSRDLNGPHTEYTTRQHLELQGGPTRDPPVSTPTHTETETRLLAP